MTSWDDKTPRPLGLFDRGRARSLTLPRQRCDEDEQGNLQFPLFGAPRPAPVAPTPKRASSKVRDKRAAREAREAEAAPAVAAHYPDDLWRACTDCGTPDKCWAGRCEVFGF